MGAPRWRGGRQGQGSNGAGCGSGFKQSPRAGGNGVGRGKGVALWGLGEARSFQRRVHPEGRVGPA